MGTFRNNANTPYLDLIDTVDRYTSRRFGFKTGLGIFLGKEIATDSSILDWEIPWTEETGGLQSMGSQKSWT